MRVVLSSRLRLSSLVVSFVISFFYIAHLASPVVVVHTFAAYAIERILFTKEEVTGGASVPKIRSADLTAFVEPLFTGLFAIVDNEEHNENDYVMKCVMRALYGLGRISFQ